MAIKKKKRSPVSGLAAIFSSGKLGGRIMTCLPIRGTAVYVKRKGRRVKLQRVCAPSYTARSPVKKATRVTGFTRKDGTKVKSFVRKKGAYFPVFVKHQSGTARGKTLAKRGTKYQSAFRAAAKACKGRTLLAYQACMRSKLKGKGKKKAVRRRRKKR